MRNRDRSGAHCLRRSRMDLRSDGVLSGALAGYSREFSFVTSLGAGRDRPRMVIRTYRAMSANVRFSAIFKPCSSTTALACSYPCFTHRRKVSATSFRK